MQPYFFPYIGYFQLINAVDTFVFYDDVNFIKRGWINRNNILVNQQPSLISISCVKPSQNVLIKDTRILQDRSMMERLKKTIYHAYHKSVNFIEVNQLFKEIIDKPHESISSLAIESVTKVTEFIGITTKFKISSREGYNNIEMNKEDRLIDIVKREGCADYVNMIGGINLYDKTYFGERGVNLNFLQPELKPYSQPTTEFVPGLSVLDLLMHESKENIVNILKNYTLK